MTPYLPWLAGAAMLAMPPVLTAHVGSGGIIDSYSGLLHPYTEPMHIIVILGLGFMLTQQGNKVPPMGWLSFCISALVGLIAAALGLGLPVYRVLLVLALALGILVAMRPGLPFYLCMALSSATGLVLGMDSILAGSPLGTMIILVISTATGLAIALLIVMGWGDYFRRDWQQVGIRVLGSWIAASALLVFTLTLKT